MVDRESVRSRLARLEAEVKALAQICDEGRQAFLDPDNELGRTVAERRLQIAEQACIDIGSSLAADAGLSPTTYAQVFDELAKAGLIERQLGNWLIAAAGQRNILIHAYQEIDPEQIWTTLTEQDRFREFAEAAARAAGIVE